MNDNEYMERLVKEKDKYDLENRMYNILSDKHCTARYIIFYRIYIYCCTLYFHDFKLQKLKVCYALCLLYL